MIKIELIPDETCKDHDEFNNVNRINIEKQDIFNYGVFHYEIPPDKIGENDFEYLQSKIPAYFLMYDDHIDIPANRNAIICNVPGEAAQKVSEIVGIAVGLKTGATLFGYKKKSIEKIGLSKKREKRLDFNISNAKIEIETKGTTGKNNISKMIKDVHDKKVGKIKGPSRYGFVTLLRKRTDSDDSKIYATDPVTNDSEPIYSGIYKYINYYMIYLSFILDNPQYNRIARVLINLTKYRKSIIKFEKIRYRFDFNGKRYYGQCFDKRLMISNIKKFIDLAKTVNKLFSLLTKNVEKEKYFLGIDEDILKSLNQKDIDYLNNYEIKDFYKNKDEVEYIQMSDGVLFIRVKNGALPEMEEQFTEDEVKSRLGGYYDYYNKSWHECGAPCRSREKEGEPCKIKTFRDHCHFHR